MVLRCWGVRSCSKVVGSIFIYCYDKKNISNIYTHKHCCGFTVCLHEGNDGILSLTFLIEKPPKEGTRNILAQLFDHIAAYL